MNDGRRRGVLHRRAARATVFGVGKVGCTGEPPVRCGWLKLVRQLVEKSEPINGDSLGAPKLPQFRLSTLMWLTTLIGGCLALVTYIGAWAAMVVGLFALMIIAHVAGNAIGMKLRQSGDSLTRQEPLPGFDANLPKRPIAESFAPTTQLRERKSLGLPVIIATGVGFLLGAALAIGLLPAMLDPKPAWEALIAAAIACGVLGSLATFAGFSFIQVATHALWQATSEPSGSKIKPIKLGQLDEPGQEGQPIQADEPGQAAEPSQPHS